MADNQPSKNDAVIGGNNPPPVSGIVLGGIEGVKHRLSSNNTEERIAALSEALNYGEAGLNLLVQALKDESEQVQNKAYSLLRQIEAPNIKQILHKYKPWQFFEYLCTTSGHSREVSCSAISLDETNLVTGAYDGIRVWDLKTGHQLYKLSNSRPTYISISPDRETFVSGFDDGRIMIWNLKTGQLIQTLSEYSRHATLTHVSSNWKIVVGVKYRSIDIWNLDTRQLVRTLKIIFGKLSCIALSFDGNLLAGSGFDNRIRLWDLKSGKEVNKLEGHSQTVCFLAINPDGKILVSVGDKTIKVWDIQTGKLINTFVGHKYRIVTAVITNDWQTIISNDAENNLFQWKIVTGQQLRTFKEDCDTFFALHTTANENRLVTVNNKTLNICNLSTGKNKYSLSLIGHLGSFRSLAISPDGSTIYTCSGDDNAIKLWDSKTGQIIRTFNNSSSFVSNILTSPDGTTILSTNGDKTIKIWDAKTGHELSTLIGHPNRILCIDISSNGKTLASGDADGNIKIWNLDTGEEIFNLHQKPYSSSGQVINQVCQLAVSPDGKILVSCTNYLYPVLQVWNLETGEEIYSLQESPVQYIAITPDGKKLISGDFIAVRDLKTGEQVATFPGRVDCLAISPDGQALFVGTERRYIKIWDLKTGELIRTIKGYPFTSCEGHTMAISRNGQTLVSGTNGNVNVWGLQ